jgi:hypothetical protein
MSHKGHSRRFGFVRFPGIAVMSSWGGRRTSEKQHTDRRQGDLSRRSLQPRSP